MASRALATVAAQPDRRPARAVNQPPTAVAAGAGHHAPVLALQRTAGNRAVAGLLGRGGPGGHGGRGLLTLQRLTAAERLINLASPQLAGDTRLENAFDNNPSLKQGASGDPVKKVQQALVDDGFALPKSTTVTGPDAKFGNETVTAVRAFQTKHGLGVDGSVGRQTLGRMDQLYVTRGGGGGGPPPIPPGQEFDIRGVSRDPNPSKIFFDKDSSAIDASQSGKVTALAAPPTRALDLKGFISEEEVPTLATNRITSVSGALAALGHTAPRNPDARPTAGAGRLQYRQARAVEVIPAGTPSTTPDCSAGSVVPCGPAPNRFTTAHARALDMIDAGVTALTPAVPDPNTAALLARLFGGVGQRTSVRNNLNLLRGHVASMPNAGRHRCANECDGSCASTIAYNDGVGAASVMTLCPSFLNDPDLDSRAGTLVHEGSHGTFGLATDDHAYGFQRLIEFLSTSRALGNADSYTLFVANIISPGSARIGPAAVDTFAGGMTPPEERETKRTLAFLEKWLEASSTETGSMYAVIHESQPLGRWNNTYYEETMRRVANRFGFTRPPALPSNPEKFSIAGIVDRYERMFRSMIGQIAVTKTPTGEETWGTGPSRSVTLTPAFFRLSRRGRLDLLLTRIIEATPQIPPGQRMNYVSLTDDLRQHYGAEAP